MYYEIEIPAEHVLDQPRDVFGAAKYLSEEAIEILRGVGRRYDIVGGGFAGWRHQKRNPVRVFVYEEDAAVLCRLAFGGTVIQ